MTIRIITADVFEGLAQLQDESVHCVVCSPPYWALRDYGVEGQIGLEPTYQEHVDTIVRVFREVRRVLRADGTVWLNYGDSYATSANGRSAAETKAAGKDDRTFRDKPFSTVQGVLKPKDLIGMPWRIARALQEPYYTGRIKRIEDRVWLAAMIDAEGCMFIHRRKAGQNIGGAPYIRADGTVTDYRRTQDSFSPGLEVANTSLAVVERCKEIVGLGSVCSQSPEQNSRRKQTIYRWHLRATECRNLIREVYPFLVAKRQQARILIAFPPSGERASAAHAALMSLHNGEPTDVDFPEPKSMFEPGWYLRSDVIWSKLNPMPESIKDRPTKAHEYVFLLSKSETYYYDSEAIRETASFENVAGKTPGNWDTSLGMGGHGTINRAGREKYRKANSTNASHVPGASPHTQLHRAGQPREALSRNKRSVWTIPTAPFPEAHFATFPPELPETCIKASTSQQGCCSACGAPWERETKAEFIAQPDVSLEKGIRGHPGQKPMDASRKDAGVPRGYTRYVTIGWRPTCRCEGVGVVPATVLDPFAGAGTTLLVADRLQRNAIGIELNPEYAAMTRQRLERDRGGLLELMEGSQ